VQWCFTLLLFVRRDHFHQAVEGVVNVAIPPRVLEHVPCYLSFVGGGIVCPHAGIDVCPMLQQELQRITAPVDRSVVQQTKSRGIFCIDMTRPRRSSLCFAFPWTRALERLCKNFGELHEIVLQNGFCHFRLRVAWVKIVRMLHAWRNINNNEALARSSTAPSDDGLGQTNPGAVVLGDEHRRALRKVSDDIRLEI